MKRIVKSDNEFYQYIKTPLFTDDVYAYQIVINNVPSNAGFFINAKRADGEVITDSGIADGEILKYTLASNMHSVEGELSLRVQVLNDSSTVTEKTFIFDVVKGEKGSINSSTDQPVLNTVVIALSGVKEDVEVLKSSFSNHKNASVLDHPDGSVTLNKLSKEDVIPLLGNAVKGKVSGKELALNDTSPIKHDLSVKIRGTEDLSSVKLYKTGKNLFDTNKITKKTETTVEVDGVSYKVYAIKEYTSDFAYTTVSTFNFEVDMKKDKTYTVSLIWMGASDGGNKAGSLYMPFRDDKGGNQCFDNMGAGSDIFNAFGVMGDIGAKPPLTKISFNIKPTENIVKGALCFYSFGVTGYVLKDSIQIEEGKNATEYMPYVETAMYDVPPDGKVYGVTSLYPTTILYTDTEGVLIDCEYNKDTNKVIENLTNAVIALGGTV